MDTKVLEAINLGQTFIDGTRQINLFENLNFSIDKGEQVAIVGRSGSGKTTLLNLLAGLSVPTSGEVRLVGESFSAKATAARDAWRAGRLGMVFQFHHLLGEFTALENVALGLRLAGKSVSEANDIAAHWLDQVGLAGRHQHTPAKLSGGERQRVAIARALAPQPPVVLMDEPTGNLDRETAEQVQELLAALVRDAQLALVVVTHDLSLAGHADRQLRLSGGQLAPVDAPSS